VISIAYKIVNVSTSEILYSGSFSAGHTGGFFNPSAGTQENALSLAIQDVRKKAGMDIKKAFPIKVKIIKVLEEDDEKVKKVLINAGASSGLTGQKDVRVVYYENIDVDGKILSRTVDVTTGEITSVVDENFSELTIRKTEKGGQKVKEKIKEGKQLYIISSK
jgi:curli biogenesis system outer membrane secretion channel CsgG